MLDSVCHHVLFAHTVPLHGAHESFQTPLHEASHRGHVHIVKYLVKHGGDIAAKVSQSHHMVHLCCVDPPPLCVLTFVCIAPRVGLAPVSMSHTCTMPAQPHVSKCVFDHLCVC